jgi:hypothetical protein
MGEQLLYLEFWKPVLLGFFAVIGFGLYCWKKSDEYNVREKEIFQVPTKNVTNHYHFYGEASKEQAVALLQGATPLSLPNTVLSQETENTIHEGKTVVLQANAIGKEIEQKEIHATPSRSQKSEIVIEPKKIDVNELILNNTAATKEGRENRTVVDVSNDYQVTELYQHLCQDPEKTIEVYQESVNEGAHSPITEERVESHINEKMKVENKHIEHVDPYKTYYVKMAPVEEAFFNSLRQTMFPDQDESSNWWGINPEQLADIKDELTISNLDQQKEDYVIDTVSVLVVGKVSGHHHKDGKYAIKFSDPALAKWVEVNKEVFDHPVDSVLMLHIFRHKVEQGFTYKLNTKLEYYVLHSTLNERIQIAI